MKATFIGVPGEDHESLLMYGQVFPKGKSITVQGKQAKSKLANHPHFKTEAEASDDVEDAQIKQEFAVAADAVLAPIEANKAEEAETIARLTDEDKYGNADAAGTGDANPAQAAGSGSSGNSGRGRRRTGA